MKFPKQVKALIFNSILDFALFKNTTNPRTVKLTENTLICKNFSKHNKIRFYKLSFKENHFEELICHRENDPHSPYTWERNIIHSDISFSNEYGPCNAAQFNILADILAVKYKIVQYSEA